MPTLISRSTGNFTAATTWAVADATSLLDSEAGNEALTTAYSGTRSQPFTPGVQEIDGIAVKVAYTYPTPSGTVSVHLALNADHSEVAGTEVILNVSDVGPGGWATLWVLFKFAAPITLLAATAYEVEAKTSVGGMVNLYRDGVADNISRLLRTTTTQAPVAGDIFHIMGEHTGAATGNNITVTGDETLTTDYGPGVDNTPAMTISKRGTLAIGVSPATNYRLKLSGNLYRYWGGMLTVGTVGSPMPEDSTFELQFDPVATGGMGLYNVGSDAGLIMQGNPRSHWYSLLAADQAASAVTCTVADSTDWKNGEDIIIASTGNSGQYAQNDTVALTADAVGTTLTHQAVTYAHLGSDPYQAEVVLLNRNIIIRGASDTLQARITFGNCDVDWAQFKWIGGNAGLGAAVNSLSYVNYCCFLEGRVTGGNPSWISGYAGSLAYNAFCSLLAGNAINQNTTLFEYNVAVGLSNDNGWSFLIRAGSIFRNNRISGASGSLAFQNDNHATTSVSDNIIHSCNSFALDPYNVSNLTVSNHFAWHCGGGFWLYQTNYQTNITLIGCSFLGCSSYYNLWIQGYERSIKVLNCTFGSTPYVTSGYGVLVTGAIYTNLFENCTFGSPVAHSIADVYMSGIGEVNLRNCVFNSSVPLQSAGAHNPKARSHNHQQISGRYAVSETYGLLSDQITGGQPASWARGGSGLCAYLDPNSTVAGNTLDWEFHVPVTAGVPFMVSFWTRTTQTVNGPTLTCTIFDSDDDYTELQAAASVSLTADWAQYTSASCNPTDTGFCRVLLKCLDGSSTGNVGADDISVSPRPSTDFGGLDRWFNGLPPPYITSSPSGWAHTFS